MVRQLVLVQPFMGSNPISPAIFLSTSRFAALLQALFDQLCKEICTIFIHLVPFCHAPWRAENDCALIFQKLKGVIFPLDLERIIMQTLKFSRDFLDDFLILAQPSPM